MRRRGSNLIVDHVQIAFEPGDKEEGPDGERSEKPDVVDTEVDVG